MLGCGGSAGYEEGDEAVVIQKGQRQRRERFEEKKLARAGPSFIFNIKAYVSSV
jgi:hypothetical protein